MSKYEKFGDYLKAVPGNVVRLSFDQIETIIDAHLPPSKQYPAWWSNSPWNNVMTKVWIEAGFKSADVDVAGEKVSFVRVADKPDATPAAKAEPSATPLLMSPLFGSMKGTTFIAEGVDLTEPADPDWGKVYDDDYMPPSAEYVVQDTTLSVADKIRELDDMGVARAQIAKLLGKRYQHVRNVLLRDQRKAS